MPELSKASESEIVRPIETSDSSKSGTAAEGDNVAKSKTVKSTSTIPETNFEQEIQAREAKKKQLKPVD